MTAHPKASIAQATFVSLPVSSKISSAKMKMNDAKTHLKTANLLPTA